MWLSITQYNVLYHIIKQYHTQLQYFVLKYTSNTLNYNITLHIKNNTLQNTIPFQTTPYHNILYNILEKKHYIIY